MASVKPEPEEGATTTAHANADTAADTADPHVPLGGPDAPLTPTGPPTQ